jgi:secreted trypsin-like serine protease
VPIVDNEKCVARYGDRFAPDSQLCAGFASGGADACFGSGGGPLVVFDKEDRKIEIGIVSWGGRGGCGAPGEYGVYTRVSSYIDWIKHIAPDVSAEAPTEAIPGYR